MLGDSQIALILLEDFGLMMFDLELIYLLRLIRLTDTQQDLASGSGPPLQLINIAQHGSHSIRILSNRGVFHLDFTDQLQWNSTDALRRLESAPDKDIMRKIFLDSWDTEYQDIYHSDIAVNEFAYVVMIKRRVIHGFEIKLRVFPFETSDQNGYLQEIVLSTNEDCSSLWTEPSLNVYTTNGIVCTAVCGTNLLITHTKVYQTLHVTAFESTTEDPAVIDFALQAYNEYSSATSNFTLSINNSRYEMNAGFYIFTLVLILISFIIILLLNNRMIAASNRPRTTELYTPTSRKRKPQLDLSTRSGVDLELLRRFKHSEWGSSYEAASKNSFGRTRIDSLDERNFQSDFIKIQKS